MIKYYLVGGYIRDQLLGIQSKDIDFSVEASSYEAMKEDLIKNGVEIFLETPQYYTIRGKHALYGAVDYVLCRKDGEYKDSRHPEEVFIGSIYDDLARRDFTVNAIAMDAETREYLDPYNGKEDLEKRILKCVGNPNERFREDSLRILRAIRFAIKYDFVIEDETTSAMNNNKKLILNLPEDRVRSELLQCFKLNTCQTLKTLDNFGLNDILFNNKKYKLWLMPTSQDK